MSKISLGQLDLEALQQYLEIIVGFRKQSDKALDVSNVAGVKAEAIALSALDSNGNPIEYTDIDGNIIIEARNTIQNALKLGGVDASEYLKRVESDTILTDVNDATHDLSDDIRNLKDELYQLKNQLIKTGAIRDSIVYNGFIDSFIESNQKHIEKSNSMILSTDGGARITVDNTNDLCVGEYLVFIENNIPVIRQIQDISSNLILLNDSVSVQPGSHIYKSLGVSENGKFVFSHRPDNGQISVDENKYIIKDGIDRVKVYELDHAGQGFGTELVIPSSLKDNIISKIQISLAVKGNPGTLIGHIYKYDEEKMQYEKLEGYATDALSPLYVSSWFNNHTFTLNKDLPVVPGEKYILIFTTNSASEDNKWFIGGFTEDNCLSDIHDDCYIAEFDGVNTTLYKTVDDKDMFLVLYTKELASVEVSRLPYGLYSCKFDVHNSLANRIRAELSINQEGLFMIGHNLNSNHAKPNESIIPIENKKGLSYNENIFTNGDTFVVDNQIGTIHSNNGNISLMTNTEMYIKEAADIYRVGYELQAKVCNKKKQLVNNIYVDTYEDIEIFPLKLVGVIPGKDMVRPTQSSDRLLFECDFIDKNDENNIKLKSFNHVELQIKWKGNVRTELMNTNTELEGAIFDIAVSVDQAYTKKIK